MSAARIAGVGFALLAGATVALLLVYGPTVAVSDEEYPCQSIVVASEGDGGANTDDAETPCDRARDRLALAAGAAGLVAVVAGTGAWFSRPGRAPA